jgi:hypothetical protein
MNLFLREATGRGREVGEIYDEQGPSNDRCLQAVAGRVCVHPRGDS